MSGAAAALRMKSGSWLADRRELHIRRHRSTDDARVLTLDGVLDATTYLPIREAIVKAALDEPRAVIIDVSGLTVREDPAWAVFTSARWQIAEWPDVPIGLVCAHDQGQNALQRNGITRYVPLYTTLESALAELAADGLRRYRRRARASLPAARSSIRRSRELAAEWLTAWSRTDFIHVVSVVATELVEAGPCGCRQRIVASGGNRRVDGGSRGTTRGHRETRCVESPSTTRSPASILSPPIAGSGAVTPARPATPSGPWSARRIVSEHSRTLLPGLRPLF